MVQRFWILLIAVCVACKPAPQQSKTTAAAGPTVRATVVTLRTIVQPGNRKVTQALVIVGDRVRDTSERDVWRLYDTKEQKVTVVDEIARTVRTEPLAELKKRRAAALAGTVAAYHPRPEIIRGGATKTLQNTQAERWLITAGAYRRELWMASHPSLPRGLFAMMQASDRITSPLSPVMRQVESAILSADGFPLADRTEVPLGDQKMVVERDVVSIVQRDVPQSLVTPSRDFRDVTPRAKTK